MFRNYRELGVLSRIMARLEGIMTSVLDAYWLACSQVCSVRRFQIVCRPINVLVVGRYIYLVIINRESLMCKVSVYLMALNDIFF